MTDDNAQNIDVSGIDKVELLDDGGIIITMKDKDGSISGFCQWQWDCTSKQWKTWNAESGERNGLDVLERE